MTQVIRTAAELRDKVAAWKRSGMLVGVVPTMGALHDGHLSLARAAREQSDRVIVTVFVNPMQFNNASDLDKYPRDEARDLALLEAEGVDVLFAPGVDEVYPDGFATTVSITGITEPLEGAFRPGHFDGVATVCSKLFGMTQAGRAFFGEKDWQQLQVVQRLVRDLNIPTRIIGCPTIREEDGLAMSSRNVRLTEAEREVAPRLHEIMQLAASEIRDGASAEIALTNAEAALLEAGFREIEYLELRTVDGLRPAEDLAEPVRMLAALWLGDVRLIDNIAV
ncbi:MAG: pantoate--beta-alanine ligase [Thioclava marina]|uniref:Pantothenate synthetase n=1 Tax=Thioclava marina TaxID=1915077 RepID=A0ABX3MQD4_9RHOB|nr:MULTISPECIES: pantoate--beta-alanine ligase [Thioclava]TNE92965.1 MAG: pantoate--beta-alanine ligase [Paracoccaceae bacterium]MBC7145437.1 pantoate--beta-alanine ligase [Thioclava marina]MBD3802422.1 pantoate--beta-alanine ligase [Thioclava sp.]OOY13607.1 pantoate--beta-alanine ligase [Thioclava marina]OOY29317.1 pantoate--beta-alanine ligase [Thioclava sp. L04-15]